MKPRFDLPRNIRIINKNDSYIINTLQRTCYSFNNSSVVARIAGGWVRDNLLGRENNDIDIAISGCSCEEFAERMKHVLGSNCKIINFSTDHNPNRPISTTRIEINKDTSIDICLLRKHDIGSGDSSEGTPKSDAMRRDFTINGLFYNVLTNKVEDYVNGIDDLFNGLIRTPIHPIDIFEDDPIRILRALRFASKYSFHIDINIKECIIQHSKRLLLNVYDRISHELMQSLSSPFYIKFFDLVIEYSLFQVLFNPNSEWYLNEKDTLERVHLLESVDSPINAELILSSIYLPIFKSGPQKNFSNNSKMIGSSLSAVLKTVKLSKSIANSVQTLQRGAVLLENIYHNGICRVAIAHYLIQMRDNWKYCFHLLPTSMFNSQFRSDVEEFVNRENLNGIWNMPPLFSPKELASILDISPGPNFKDHINRLLEWQILNPQGTKSEYLSYVKQ